MKRAAKCLAVLCTGAMVFTSGITNSFAGTPHDGAFYFDTMKEAMIEVVNENQKLINTAADGSVKNKKLIADAFYKNTMREFKRLKLGRSFSMDAFKSEADPTVIAPVLATLLTAGRINTAKSQKIINTESDGSVKLKKFIPAVFGRLTLEKFTAKSGAYMKQTTLGKGKYKARNPYNEPNTWETAALEKIMAPGWKDGVGYGEMAGSEYHYVKPIYIKKACLPCHSVPVGENGPYGHPKEGYKLGDTRGGISVSLPVK